MALGEPLPKQVFGHPWLLQGEGKMSKSKGNVIYADDLVSLFGVDAVRYFVMHEMPFENDGIISWELMVERMNSDLANTLGNLVNRTIAMSNKYFGGVVRNTGGYEDPDRALKEVVTGTATKVVEKMDELRIADALTEIFALFRRCNKYIDETEPWVLAKDEAKKDRLATVLYHLIESITIGASLLQAFMPNTAESIFKQLNTTCRDYTELDQFGLYESGKKVTDTPEILFARADLKETLEKVDALYANQAVSASAAEGADGAAQSGSAQNGEEGKAIHLELKDEITYDVFDQCQFAVGEVISCEEVPKSKKLLLFRVKIGDQTRQIVSGIKKWYRPEDLVGKKVMVLVNLKPAKLAGLMSEGMLLSAEDADGNVSLMTSMKDMPSGSEIC